MLMDNLGHGELGVYGGGILRGAATPRIDALAAEGMLLLMRLLSQPLPHGRAPLPVARLLL